MNTLGDALPAEQARVRVILGHCREIGPPGNFLAAMIEMSLQRADKAVMSGDLVAMIAAYEDLKGFQE